MASSTWPSPTRRGRVFRAPGQRRRHLPSSASDLLELSGAIPVADGGRRFQPGWTPRPGRRDRHRTRLLPVSSLRCCWATATARSSHESANGSGETGRDRGRRISPATADLDLAAVNDFTGDVSILLGNGDGTFQPAGHVRGGDRWPDGDRGRRFQRRRADRPGRRRSTADSPTKSSVLLGNGDGTFQPRRPTRWCPARLHRGG